MRVGKKLVSTLTTALVAVCAFEPSVPATAGSSANHLAGARAELERRADADSLAAAGLLSAQSDRAGAVSLVTRAANAAPQRADLVWLHIMLCREVPYCDSEPLEHRLRELDSTNGASWLGTMARADAAKDDAALTEALDGLARSDHVDIYWTTLVARLSEAAYHTGKVPLPEAVVAILGVLAAEAIPAYQLTARSCKADALSADAAVERCRAIAASLERGDTNITEMIGIVIAKRVWPADSPEWKAADDAKRTLDYRAKVSLDLVSPKSMKRYLALCGENRREQDVLRQQIIDAGLNPDPPRAP